MTPELPWMAGAVLLVCLAACSLAVALLYRRLRQSRDALDSMRQAFGKAEVDAVRDRTLYRIVTEDTAAAVVRLDVSRRPDHVSPGAGQVLGIEPDELLRSGEFVSAHPEDLSRLRAAIAGCSPTTPVRHTIYRAQQADSRLSWIETRCRYVPETEEVVLLLRDISRQQLIEDHLAEARDRLERLALRDPLTGLLNRSGFLAAADRLLAEPQPLAVLFIDLDHFKTLNDMHGHAIGDSILREAGVRLARTLGHATTAARLSADEFAAIAPMTEGDLEIAARARDIVKAMAEPIRIGSLALNVGVTIGIAVSPRDGHNTITMLRAADIALAYAKTAGGGSIRFFEARMGEALERETELKNEVRAALAAGEIVPYYQPLVRLGDTSVVGFEVLARWVHPQKGVLPPAQFLPLIEELGLSTELFTTQLACVCRTTRNWPAHIRLSVNISPQELQDQTLPAAVKSILDGACFDGSRLEVEITENALVRDSKVARDVLHGLRVLGMTVSLDDFGTGYSSLYHLRELPFDKVKIDKSFMQALDTDAESARYVAAIIGLCHALGLEMTAEGIEDEPTLRRLRDLGCTYGQGYVFGRPAPAEEAERVIASNGWPALAAE